MNSQGTILGRKAVHRALAVLACLALLYFASGGVLFHEHANGPDTACHICQALHMPALAAARQDLVAASEPIYWYFSLPQSESPSTPFFLHRPGRAPPTV